MRGFFTAAALFGILGSACFFVSRDAVTVHRLFFLNLLPACAYSGFLLTAMPSWTDYRGSIAGAAKMLGGTVAAAWAVSFFNVRAGAALLACLWLMLLFFCARMVFLGKDRRNFSVLMLLFLLAAFQTAYAFSLDGRFLRAQLHLNIAATVLIGFRISIVMGAEALKECRLKDPLFVPNAVYKNMAVVFLAAYAFIELLLPAEAAGYAALGCGCILLARLKELHHRELLRKHYLALYYAVQLSGACGYLWLGVGKIRMMPDTPPLHLIALCCMFGTVLLVFITAGLRHSSFVRLDYPKLSRAAFACLAAAAVSRTLLFGHGAWFYLYLPALFLAAAFTLYLADFVPVFKNRPFYGDPE